MLKKNIAILLGVWNYEKEKKLPPCLKDVQTIFEIIKSSKKFDDILLVDEDAKSSSSKEKISNFVRGYHGQEIGELFFYYTGHGTRKGDDFLFLFSDFDKEKFESTSLRNSELDTMLKSLSPDLTVKVVDACQAGTEYIKAEGDLKTIFEKTVDSFKNIYFFFSSSNAESSVALYDMSVFTKSFLKSLIPFEGKEIRYRDIMASISDDPSVKKHQTPLFIQQATNTEIFFNVSSEIIKKIDFLLKIDDLENENKFTVAQEVLVSTLIVDDSSSESEQVISSIKAKSVSFCTEEEAQNTITNFFKMVESYKWSKIISSLYEIELTKPLMYQGVTRMEDIGKWVKENAEPYFANIEYKNEEYIPYMSG